MKKAKDEGSKKSSGYSPAVTKDTSVQFLKGVGPVRARLLEKLNIRTLEDILYHFPRRYEDRRNLSSISDLKPGIRETTFREGHNHKYHHYAEKEDEDL